MTILMYFYEFYVDTLFIIIVVSKSPLTEIFKDSSGTKNTCNHNKTSLKGTIFKIEICT